MKKILSTLLALALLCGVMAFGASAYDEENYGSLEEQGEALLRETLAVLTGGEFTIRHGGDGVLSYNGERFASTWGLQRVIDLYGKDLYYEVNRNFRLYFKLPAKTDDKSLQMFFALTKLEMPGAFTVTEIQGYAQGYIYVDFEAGGYTFRFGYENGSLDALLISDGSYSTSIHPDKIENKAIDKLFETSWMIPLPAWSYDTVWALLLPCSFLFTMFWNLVGPPIL